jgi:hypothetical protein
MNEEAKLTKEQEEAILNAWNSCEKDNAPSLLELIQDAAGFENKDGRSKEGRAVKKFLASRKIKARGAHQYLKQTDQITWTEEEKEFMINNIEAMKPLEMARYLKKDDSITVLGAETRAVRDFLTSQGINPSVGREPSTEENEEIYKPPKSIDRAITRVNKYVNEQIDKEDLNSTIKKNILKLMGYLSTYRFCHQINTYRSTTDKELFESSFIRYTNDKSDLTQEEVDQYIVLSQEVVISANIQRRVERLSQLMDEAADDNEGRRISMGLVEAINTAQTEYNQCVGRQQKLLESLKEKRSQRLSKQIKENASILNLVAMWRQEESRNQLIKLAELKKKAVEEEVEKLSSMDEIKAQILGLTPEEAING